MGSLVFKKLEKKKGYFPSPLLMLLTSHSNSHEMSYCLSNSYICLYLTEELRSTDSPLIEAHAEWILLSPIIIYLKPDLVMVKVCPKGQDSAHWNNFLPKHLEKISRKKQDACFSCLLTLEHVVNT